MKNLLIEARRKVYDFFNGVKSIDTLLRDKVEDYILTEEIPMSVAIGTKTLYVGNLSIDNDTKFFEKLPEIIACLGIQLINFELLADGLSMIKYLHISKKFRKKLIKLLADVLLNQQYIYFSYLDKPYKTNKISKRYFKRWITKEKIIQLCYLIYLYNYDAEKKNLSIIAERMGVAELSQTYIYSWLENCPGLTGNFVKRQLTNYDLSPEELASLDHIKNV